ncbi:MAG: hypothetical protein WDW36_003606 [Sanguina aurantia]
MDDEQSRLTALRLVNKEASRVALLALRYYTLTLSEERQGGHMNGSVARLIRQTQLQELTVTLLLSDSHSPAGVLEAFVHEVGPALGKLISLDVQLQDTRSCIQTAPLLDTALALLASACPALTSFHTKGPLPTAFLGSLGQHCPLLTTLTVVCPDPCDAPFLTGLLLQQPSLLPHITDLDLYDCTDGYELTGLSANTGISSLYMQCWHFRSQEQWLSLPPKLQHLRFMYMDEGPPTTFADGSPALGSLLSIEMEEWPPTLCLHAFTQILRAAPTFHRVNTLCEPGERSSVIQCNMAGSKVASIPADLALLLEKQKGLPSLKDATICIDGTVRGAGQSIVSVIAELPLMLGVARFEFHGLEPAYLRVSSYHASARDLAPKFSLPNCTQCYGCSTHLMSMAESTRFADRNFTNEKGATSGWLFRAHTNKTASGIAVVKAYCIPVAKVKGGKIAQCNPATILRTMKLFLAIQRISKDCGFEDMVPRVWIDKIDGVVPSNSYYQAPGYHIRWYGLWMEYVNGISLENFLHRGLPVRFPPEYVINFFENRINKTQAVRAEQLVGVAAEAGGDAVGRLAAAHFFSKKIGRALHAHQPRRIERNGDARARNRDELRAGEMVAIEKNGFGVAHGCLTGNGYDGGRPGGQHHSAQCWVDTPNEEIGNAYPPKLKRCLARMAGMTLPELQEAYGMQDAHSANVLHRRASDMHNHGFEWTFKYGWPQNMDTKRYRLQPKCCSLRYAQGIYRCNHPWEPLMDLPIGDPITGKAWTKARPDTGTYKGGTVF